MRTAEWLTSSCKKLQKLAIHTARLDCLILLEDASGKDRSWLLAHPEFALQEYALQGLNKKLARRLKHEPLAYIRGKSEFYGREFIVSPDTLQPRPETEAMITLLRDLVESRKSKVENIIIADIGTGSGCLAVTAKLEFPDAEVIATDISQACLKIAEQNAKNLGADITFFQGNLLQPLLADSPEPRVQSKKDSAQPLLVIIANLPYVPDAHPINQAATHEPSMAIFGGPDGLDLYRQLYEQISRIPEKPKYILTESLPPQHKKLAILADSAGYKLHKTNDFIQCFQKV